MHFNITKPQSNDYFSLGVMNDNYDEIDDVMYANQQSAAKVMVGATSLADGESGRVPAPTSADCTKYLKGDGTWDTPPGGGGSTVTITPTLATGRKIAEYEIDGTNGSLFAPLVEITGEASGSIATFTDGADGKPVKNLEISIEPVQSGSGDPSPSNVRPISGWSGANVTRCGVNVWDEEWEQGYIDAHGENTANINNIRSKNFIPIIPNTRYYLKSGYTTIVYCPIFFYDENKVLLSNNLKQVWNTVITTPSNARYMRFYMNSAYGSVYNNDISINYPSTDTEYHAYNGSTISIPFHDSSDNPITVYGGTLDVLTGELVVDRGMVDFGTLDWVYSSETNRERFSASLSGVKWVSDSIPINAICSALVVVDFFSVYSHITDNAIGMWNGTTLAVNSSAYTDVATFKTAMNGVQLVYELATPQTYQLTPTQVSTLLGQNNIFADCGDVEEVVYVRDINLAFNQLEARVAALEGSNSRSVSLTKSAPIEETKEETKEEEPNEVKEKEEKR